MHLFGRPKKDANLGYKHGGPIHPIIQYIFTTNINIVVHKLIEWRGEDKSPIHKRAPSRTMMRKITWFRRVYKV
jgi:hypothetical protein